VTGTDLKLARTHRGWTQQQAARKLGVTQAYLSMLEGGRRAVPDALAVTIAGSFEVSPVALPLEQKRSTDLAADLGALGYPGFAYLSRPQRRNPAALFLDALSREHLGARVTEALPWLAFGFADMNWNWLLPRVKVRDRQNRLGFIVRLAQIMAEGVADDARAAKLKQVADRLARSRLLLEDTLGGSSLTNAEREWLRVKRSEDAVFWNVLTDLRLEDLQGAQ
jgi:transcriptional regulator with XRE-family HTH domain